MRRAPGASRGHDRRHRATVSHCDRAAATRHRNRRLLPGGLTVRLTGVDHYVLTVADPEAIVAWYRDELGLTPERLEEWRRSEVLFVSLRVNATTLIDVL